MEDVKWLEVTLDTTEAELDALCARLTGNGVTGLAIEDEEDFKTFLEQNHQYWDYVDDGLLARMKGVCRVKFYITDDADGRKQLEGWLAGIDQPYSLASLGDNDWAHSWQKYYKPMPVGERLYIVPEWERGEPVPAGKAPLYLNPGLTFGTGSHASTQLCLMGLERYTVPGKPVLDLGCGSGILSIAALVLGASAAAAVDIDPKAVDVAYENAALNGIGRDRYTVRAGNVLTDGALVAELARQKYALVLANIVADVIIPLSARAGEFLDTDGVFLCSGIIDTRAGEVEAALERVGLAERAGHKPTEMSGGQQQRVAIARAIATQPPIIMADEPTGALDSRTGREVLGFLQKLNAEGDTVVLITHDNSIAVKAKRIVRLQDGRIIYDGDAHDPKAVVQPELDEEVGAL